jgi:hypothetical protein
MCHDFWKKAIILSADKRQSAQIYFFICDNLCTLCGYKSDGLSKAYSFGICILRLTARGLFAEYEAVLGCQRSSVVEQRTHKPLVGGSNPPAGTKSNPAGILRL